MVVLYRDALMNGQLLLLSRPPSCCLFIIIINRDCLKHSVCSHGPKQLLYAWALQADGLNLPKGNCNMGVVIL